MAPAKGAHVRSPSKRQSPWKNVKSPTKTTMKQATIAPPGRKRGPQHCKQCPDWPLRMSLQCIHSKAYNALKKAVTATGRECPGSASAADLQAMLCTPPSNLQAPSPNVSPPASAAPMPNTDPQVATPPHRALTTPMSSPVNLNPDSSPLNPFTAIVSNFETPSTTRSYRFEIDPCLLEPELEASPSQGSLDDASQATLASPQMSNTSPEVQLSPHPTMNIQYGFVEGLGRGSQAWDVPQSHPLPQLLPSSKDCTHRYRRSMHRLVNQLEQISASTGCWMYFSALLPNSHMGFQHFTSCRLLDEPDHALLDDLHHTAARTFSSLQMAHRADSQQLACEVHSRDLIIASQEVQKNNLQAQKDDLKREVERQRLLLAQYHGVTAQTE
ncbi:hypothetical protein GYMLUDRAFT_245319 [Collybiopsis luxurians FD-317 M1]|uniref:Uncharacterized protein n=1 Tax=Collybiopsis luxurians FD-317 M1 TaxID=944289 RepID=A0A0D0BUR2_9AGAR|nr:hypothetical protein GYMLUDRAFT_245319 [Collybiopsis luxurians FD-317 M1]